MAFAVPSFFSRRNVLIILASIAFIVLCIFAYSYLRRLKDPVIPAFHAIPANAVMLAEIKKPDEFWKHLQTKNKIWSALLGSSGMNDFNTAVLFLDSLISQSKGLHEISEKKPLFIAFCESKNNMNVLFLINTMGPHDEKLIGKFIRKNFSVSHRIAEQHYGGLNFTELKKDKSAVYVYVDQGICAISSDSACLRQSADALRNRSGLAFQKNFVQLQAISGKNVDANIYFIPGGIKPIARKFLTETAAENISVLFNSAPAISLDLTMKNSELVFAGYASSSDPGCLTAALFKNQQAQSITISSIAPANTSAFYAWGLSDVPGYLKAYCSYKNIPSQPGFRQQVFAGLSGSQMAYLQSKPFIMSEKETEYLLIHFNETSPLADSLHAWSVPACKLNTCDSSEIRMIHSGFFSEHFFGNLYQIPDSLFFTSLNDFFVFASDIPSLEVFIASATNGQVLDNQKSYRTFADNISEKAIFSFYFNIQKNKQKIIKWLNPDYQAFLEKNPALFNVVSTLGLQISEKAKGYYVNLNLDHQDSLQETPLPIWKSTLDTAVAGKPSLIYDHADKTMKIVFMDKARQLNLMNRFGKTLWKQQLPEIPISPVFAVYDVKAKESFVLCNSASFIYIYDMKGKPHKASPVRLPLKATAPMAVMDYDNKHDYRIVLPLSDNKIYNFMLNGQAVKGWNHFQVPAEVTRAVTHIKTANKDFLVLSDVNNKVYILDRKGKSISVNFNSSIKSANSGFYASSFNGSPYLLFSDHKGNVVIVTARGEVSSNNFGGFSEKHSFYIVNTDNESGDEYVFVDNGKIVVFNQKKQKVFESIMDEMISEKLHILSGTNSSPLLAAQTGQGICLSNLKGNSCIVPFENDHIEIISGMLFGPGYPCLIVFSGNNVFSYLY